MAFFELEFNCLGVVKINLGEVGRVAVEEGLGFGLHVRI